MTRGAVLMISVVLIGAFAGATAQIRPATATATVEVYKSPT